MGTTGYLFSLTCPGCGSPIRQVNAVRSSSVSALAVIECTNPACRKQHDLAVRLTPLRSR